jgi:ribosomal protein S26
LNPVVRNVLKVFESTGNLEDVTDAPLPLKRTNEGPQRFPELPAMIKAALAQPCCDECTGDNIKPKKDDDEPKKDDDEDNYHSTEDDDSLEADSDSFAREASNANNQHRTAVKAKRTEAENKLPSLKCRNDDRGLIQSFSALRSGSGGPEDSRKRSLSGFAKTFDIKNDFTKYLEQALEDRTQKLFVLLVDLDNVPHFWQPDALSRSPFKVFTFGSANHAAGVAFSSSGNMHFSLALKTKDAADAILNLIAGYLLSLISAFDRQGDVLVVPISDDQIFLQTTQTLNKGGTPAMIMSRADAARGLSPKQLAAAHNDSSEIGTTTDDSSDNDSWCCDQCSKEFATERALEQHQRDTGHVDSWCCDQCSKEFATERALEQHQEATGHVDSWCCDQCSKEFATERALEQHQRDTGHVDIGSSW